MDRSLNYIYENLRDFWVYVENNKIAGCCALHIVGWQDLGEIKSLGVDKSIHQRGIGTKLVKKCITEAKALGLKKVFALTFVPGFFKKLGFNPINTRELPHKIWSDCINCVFFPDCKEEAVIRTI